MPSGGPSGAGAAVVTPPTAARAPTAPHAASTAATVESDLESLFGATDTTEGRSETPHAAAHARNVLVLLGAHPGHQPNCQCVACAERPTGQNFFCRHYSAADGQHILVSGANRDHLEECRCVPCRDQRLRALAMKLSAICGQEPSDYVDRIGPIDRGEPWPDLGEGMVQVKLPAMFLRHRSERMLSDVLASLHDMPDGPLKQVVFALFHSVMYMEAGDIDDSVNTIIQFVGIIQSRTRAANRDQQGVVRRIMVHMDNSSALPEGLHWRLRGSILRSIITSAEPTEQTRAPEPQQRRQTVAIGATEQNRATEQTRGSDGSVAPVAGSDAASSDYDDNGDNSDYCSRCNDVTPLKSGTCQHCSDAGYAPAQDWGACFKERECCEDWPWCLFQGEDAADSEADSDSESYSGWGTQLSLGIGTALQRQSHESYSDWTERIALLRPAAAAPMAPAPAAPAAPVTPVTPLAPTAAGWRDPTHESPLSVGWTVPPPDEDGDLAPEELVRELARYLERPTAGPPTPAEPVQYTLADFAGPPWPAVVEAPEPPQPSEAPEGPEAPEEPAATAAPEPPQPPPEEAPEAEAPEEPEVAGPNSAVVLQGGHVAHSFPPSLVPLSPAAAELWLQNALEEPLEPPAGAATAALDALEPLDSNPWSVDDAIMTALPTPQGRRVRQDMRTARLKRARVVC